MNENMENTEKILNSLDKMERAQPSSDFYAKLMQRIEKGEAVVVSIKPTILWQAAACIAVLVVLNVFTWTQSNKTESTVTTENSNPIAQEYFSSLNTPQF